MFRIIPFVVLLIFASLSPANAAVFYQFKSVDDFDFSYQATNYIASDTDVAASDLVSCDAHVLAACASIGFKPKAFEPLTGDLVDEIDFRFDSVFGPGTNTYRFSPDAFAAPGHYVSLNLAATLDVQLIQTVPLPAAAPSFGAALIVLGMMGRGLKRRASTLAT